MLYRLLGREQSGASSKRAVGMALLISIGNLSGIAGSNIYLAQEAPHFWTGYGFSLGIMVATIIMTLILRRDYIKENARRDAMSEDEINAKYTEDELGRSEPVLPLYTLGRIVPSLGETG